MGLPIPQSKTLRRIGLFALLLILGAGVKRASPPSLAGTAASWRAPSPALPTPTPLPKHHPPHATSRDTGFTTPITTTLDYTLYLPLSLHNYPVFPPELVVTHVSFDTPNIVAGRPFRLSVTVHNQGAGDTRSFDVPAWFTVEVYIKDDAFDPSGAPTNALDHAGGFCSNGSPNCTTGTSQPSHLTFISGLGPGVAKTAVFDLTFPHSDLYDLYVQADTTWDAAGYTGQPWGQHQEQNERNNIFAVEDIFVPAAP